MTQSNSSFPLKTLGLVAVAVLVTAFTLVAASTATTTTYASSRVLGDDTKVEGSQETPKPAETSEPKGTPKIESNVQVEGSHQTIEVKQGSQQLKIETQGNQQEGQIETKEGKFKFKVEDGILKTESETPKGSPIPPTQADDRELEKLMDAEDLHIATEEGELQFEHNNIAVRTNFPLSIDPGTRRLIVTTPAGVKPVAVLPDIAIENLLSSGVISQVASSSAGTAAPLTLETRDGQTVYRVEGEKEVRVLGLFPAVLNSTAFVSTDTGVVVATQQSLLASILKLLSR